MRRRLEHDEFCNNSSVCAHYGCGDRAADGAAHTRDAQPRLIAHDRCGGRSHERTNVALAKYQDTTAAVADGYRMFMPNVKTQRVFHFTNYRNAFLEALRFDPEKPTSLLYQGGGGGQLELIGAMYSAPRRMRASKLDDRVPLSIARWHKHVNWCLPKKDDAERWLERRDGLPLFGPESPIATRSECEKVGGRFYPNLFGWMIHANVFLGHDLATVFGHGH